MKNFKVLALSILTLGVSSPSWAYHNFFFRSANDITSGILDNRRLDVSSVTLRGNLWDDQVDASTTALTAVIAFSTSTLGALQRTYDVYAGAPGNPNRMDTIIGGSESFDAILATPPVNARGLTINTTVHATIFISSGIYDVCGATIPQGVEIWATAGSSTVFRPTNNVCRMFTVYGALHNITFDLQSRVKQGQMVSIASGGVVDGFILNNAENGDQATNLSLTNFMIEYATNVVLQGKVNSYSGAPADNYRGGLVTVWQSTNVRINLDIRGGKYAANSKQTFFLRGSRNVTIDGNFDETGGTFILEYGENKDIFIRGYHHITQPYNQYIHIRPLEFGSISTGTVISAVFYHDVATNLPLIDMQDETPLRINGVSVTGCTAYTNQSTFPSAFAIVRTGTVRAVFTNNRVYGMPFITDAGDNTQYTNLENFKDGIQQ